MLTIVVYSLLILPVQAVAFSPAEPSPPPQQGTGAEGGGTPVPRPGNGKDADKTLFEAHSGELIILAMFVLLVATLIVLVPQLLRAHLRKSEMAHLENMKALESGQAVAPVDERSRVAGRTAMLVPMVVVIAAGTVTCFLVAYKSESVFTVSLAVWAVAGIVGLAAITGGVALIGRLAQLQTGEQEQEAKSPFEG